MGTPAARGDSSSFFSWILKFDALGVPYFLFGSTLNQIYLLD